MKSRYTPETNAVNMATQKIGVYAGYCKILTHARKLERQRNALIDALDAISYLQRCGCGHQFRKRCANDRMCREAIATVKVEQQ